MQVISSVRGVTLERVEQVTVSSSLGATVVDRAEQKPSHYDVKSIDYFREQISQLSLENFVPKALEKYNKMLPTLDAKEYAYQVRQIVGMDNE